MLVSQFTIDLYILVHIMKPERVEQRFRIRYTCPLINSPREMLPPKGGGRA